MNCARCRECVDREHSWHRIERGAVINGQRVPVDRDFCTPACLAAWLDEGHAP